MLKLIYCDDSFRLDRLTQSVENWVKSFAVLALRTAQDFYLEPSNASFLILKDLPLVAELHQLQGDCEEILKISSCDAEYDEVSLTGHWITHEDEDGDCCGIFVCALGDRPELCLEKIWQESQNLIPIPDE